MRRMEKEKITVSKLRIIATRKIPELGREILKIPIEIGNFETSYTDGRKIYISEKQCENFRDTIFVYLHELFHNILGHTTRNYILKKYGIIGNIAADVVVNSMLYEFLGYWPSFGEKIIRAELNSRVIFIGNMRIEISNEVKKYTLDKLAEELMEILSNEENLEKYLIDDHSNFGKNNEKRENNNNESGANGGKGGQGDIENEKNKKNKNKNGGGGNGKKKENKKTSDSEDNGGGGEGDIENNEENKKKKDGQGKGRSRNSGDAKDENDKGGGGDGQNQDRGDKDKDDKGGGGGRDDRGDRGDKDEENNEGSGSGDKRGDRDDARDNGDGGESTDSADDSGDSDANDDQGEILSRHERKEALKKLAKALSRIFKERGTIPEFLEELIKAREIQKIPLKRWLAENFQKKFGYTVQDIKRPHKKYYASTGMYLPRRRGISGEIAVIIDTSASMEHKELSTALGIINMLSKRWKAEITIIQADTEVKKVTKIKNGKRLKEENIVGRGGTVIAPAIEFCAKKKFKDVLVITDGYTDNFLEKKPAWMRVQIAVTDEGGYREMLGFAKNYPNVSVILVKI